MTNIRGRLASTIRPEGTVMFKGIDQALNLFFALVLGAGFFFLSRGGQILTPIAPNWSATRQVEG